jgi:OOP family OmpA-OmpF porin
MIIHYKKSFSRKPFLIRRIIMLKIYPLPIVSLLALGFLPLPQASADETLDTRWYAAPFASFVLTDNDRNASNGWGGGLGLGKIIDQHFNVELKGFYQGFTGQNGPWSMSGGTAEAQYYFSRQKFSPYTVVSAGGMDTCLGPKCGTGLIGELGMGFSYELHDNLQVRSDVRYRYNHNLNANLQAGTNEFSDLIVNVGFVIPFGDKPKPAILKVETPAPVASTPHPAVTDCSTLDSDQDGVNNCADKCPDTVKDSKVDNVGCPIRLILKGQHFKVDSAKLSLEAKKILDEVAASLTAYPEKHEIEVQGHTSSEGSTAHNQKLSATRARSVVTYLKSKGVTNKLSAKAYGKSRPVADNKTEAGRSENRRVELIWIQD